MDASYDDLKLERQLCFALSVASRSVIASYRPVLEKLGLTHPQYLVMLALWERSPRTVKDISEALLLEPATMTPLLRRLEDAGLLTRTRQPGNERALDVALTPEGAALREKALAVPPTMMSRLQITREEAGELHASMMKLIASAQASRDLDGAEALVAQA
ncbi:MarR family winged helix-turn-helix transcriptional regulator [Sinomonas sp. R1AF57]|uniref:MarR family winged helix-turn-helix transcriptional regulator n=1 Tax=Sinomonas sp. R1AF57 TaxID=2020377 RepID=UPI000B5FBAEE|nr:MarR family transcriptional regulator [Sinomonas sp. R1AF57]ASN50900.1 MarR family transcriptional regulator [Sinomonas sp. R1AF57]